MTKMATGGEEDRFLCGVRRKVNHCANLLLSGNHYAEVIIRYVLRLEDLLRQVTNAANGGLLSQELAGGLSQSISGLLTEAKTANSALQQNTLSVTSYKAPRTRHGFEVTRDQLIVMQSSGLSIKEMALAVGVSTTTISRRLQACNLQQRKRYTLISDDELDGHVRNITSTNKLIGAKAVYARLKGQHIFEKRDRVRESMRRVDPAGTALRAMISAPIRRRLYSVPGPNALWHIDGNHKLVRWKIYVHGGIDGFTRAVVLLQASNNNRAQTVKDLFVEATGKWGVPSRIRTDRGVENQQVIGVITQHHGQGRGSAIQGTSVHNQRIEQLWGLVWKDVLNPFYSLFMSLSLQQEDGGQGIVDLNNRNHMWALHFVFLPRINKILEIFVQQ